MSDTTNTPNTPGSPGSPGSPASPAGNQNEPAIDITGSAAAPVHTDPQGDAGKPAADPSLDGATDGAADDGADHRRRDLVSEDDFLAGLDRDAGDDDDEPAQAPAETHEPATPDADYQAALDGLKALKVPASVLEGMDRDQAIAWFNDVQPTLAANAALNTEDQQAAEAAAAQQAAAQAPQAPTIPEAEAAAIQAVADAWGEDLAAPLRSAATQVAAVKHEISQFKQINADLRNEVTYLRDHLEKVVVQGEISRLQKDHPGLSDAKRVEKVKATAIKLLTAGTAADITDAMTKAAAIECGPDTVKQRQQAELRNRRLRDGGQPAAPSRTSGNTTHPTPEAAEDAALLALDRGATREEAARTYHATRNGG